MSAPENLEIVLIPGAFHPAACFDSFRKSLHDKGFSTQAASLPSFNPTDPSLTTPATDAEYLKKNFLQPLVEKDEKNVVIFAHSYGGIPGAAAAVGLDSVTRARQGKKGGIIGLLFISSNIVKEGDSLLDGVGGQFPPFIKLDTPSPGFAIIDPPIPVLLADVEEPLASSLAKIAGPHSLTAFKSPAPPQAWALAEFQGRRGYIRCAQDACLPASLQDAWIAGSGVEWDVRNVEASHSAFVSQENTVCDLVVEFSRKWAAINPKIA